MFADRRFPAVRISGVLLLAVLTVAGDPASASSSGDDSPTEQALAELQSRIDADPEDLDALRSRADLLRRLERYDEARAAYRSLSELSPQESDPWFWLGTLDRWSERLDDSIDGYDHAIAVDPCRVDALTGRARSRLGLGDHDAAIVDLRRALDCDPNDSEAVDLLAAELDARGRSDEARALIARIYSGPERTRRTAALDLAAGRHEEAILALRAELARDAGDAATHRLLGEALRQAGDGEAALESYRLALEIEPDDVGSLYWVGVLALRHREFDAGVAAFEALLRLEPDNVAALVGKARLLRSRGQTEGALELVDHALRIEPNNGEALVLKGQLLAAAGRTEEARALYRAALDADPLDGDACATLAVLPPERAWGLDLSGQNSVVIEGLEDEGLFLNGEFIEPTRIRYLIERFAGDANSLLVNQRTRVVAEVARGRQAVRNLDLEADVYDFDLTEALAGIDQRLTDRWLLRLRLGAIRYESNDGASIDDQTEALAQVQAERKDTRSTLKFGYDRLSFIQRAFASDFAFGIFVQDRLGADYVRDLRRGRALSASAAFSNFDDGSDVVNARVAYGEVRGERGWEASLGYDPFPARFLTEDNGLDFIDLTTASARGWTPLGPRGLAFMGRGLFGYYGETPELIDVDLDDDGDPDARIDGPLRHNTAVFLNADLLWRVSAYRPVSLGLALLFREWAFDSAPYNTNDIKAVSPYVQLENNIGVRWFYALRYAHGFLSDQRDSSYGSNELSARFDGTFGRCSRRRGAIRLGIEARYSENGLDEDDVSGRVWLRYPF